VHQVGFSLHEGWKYLCDEFHVLHYLSNITRIRILGVREIQVCSWDILQFTQPNIPEGQKLQ